MKWQVWAEGYKASGDAGTATLLGEAEADTFEAACRKVASKRSDPQYFNFSINRPPAYWGCRLFANEAEAREAFG